MAASGVPSATTIRPSTSRSVGRRQPFGHRIRQRPVAGAAAQRGGRLQGIGVGADVELPRTQPVEDRGDERFPGVGLGFGLLEQLVAAGRLERAKGLAPKLFGFVAQVEDHDAANRARDSSMRCTSMLPDATVDACEYRQWSSTSARKYRVAASSLGTAGHDLHQYFGAVLVEFGNGDPVRGRVAGLYPSAALQRDHPIGEQPRAAAMREHSRPPPAQFGGQIVPAGRRAPTALRPAGVHIGHIVRCRPARTTSRPARSTSPRRPGRARRLR